MSDTPQSAYLWSYRSADSAGLGHLTGYQVRAQGRRLGRVLRTSDQPSAALLVVNTGPWIFGSQLAVPAGLISDVDDSSQTVQLAAPKDRLKHAPAYRADSPEDFEDFRTRTTAYFGAGDQGNRLSG